MRWSAEDNHMRIVEDQVEIDQEIPEDVISMHEIIKMAIGLRTIRSFTNIIIIRLHPIY